VRHGGRPFQQRLQRHLLFLETPLVLPAAPAAFRYDAATDGNGLDATPLASHTEGPGYRLPINVMVADNEGNAVRIFIGPDGQTYH
jgi:hypothetical protein